jgi:hypothetical protein
METRLSREDRRGDAGLISIAVAAAIGAAVGAIGMGAASAATGNIPGLNIALQHIPREPTVSM